MAVGAENNIALVPVGVLIASAIGCSRLVGVTMAVGGIAIGFALSPINPYTVGVAQEHWRTAAVFRLVAAHLDDADLPGDACRLYLPARGQHRIQDDQPVELSRKLKDYALSRNNLAVLGIFLAGLVIMLFGVFIRGWYIKEIAGNFLLMAIPGSGWPAALAPTNWSSG